MLNRVKALNFRSIKAVFLTWVFLSTGMTFSFSVNAAEIEIGKKLHDAHCLKCHTTSKYEVKNRKIMSLPLLQTRVRGCYKVAGAKWSDTQYKAVVHYLNKVFYKFPEKTK